jgi:hypothetical protein
LLASDSRVARDSGWRRSAKKIYVYLVVGLVREIGVRATVGERMLWPIIFLLGRGENLIALL